MHHGLIHLHQGMSRANACIRLCSGCRCLCRAEIRRGSRRCRCLGHTCSHCRPIPRYTETRITNGMSGRIQAECKHIKHTLCLCSSTDEDDPGFGTWQETSLWRSMTQWALTSQGSKVNAEQERRRKQPVDWLPTKPSLHSPHLKEP